MFLRSSINQLCMRNQLLRLHSQNCGRTMPASRLLYSIETFPAMHLTTLLTQPVGSDAALSSWLLDRKSLKSSFLDLARVLKVTAVLSGQFTVNNVCLVSGGASFIPDYSSGLTPAWRYSCAHNIIARGWAPGTNETQTAAVHRDISETEVGSMRALAPETGGYIK